MTWPEDPRMMFGGLLSRYWEVF